MTRAHHRPGCPVQQCRDAGDRHDSVALDAMLGPDGEDPACSCPPVKRPKARATPRAPTPAVLVAWRELGDNERLLVLENLRERAATARWWSAKLFEKTAREQAAERAAKRPDDQRIIIAARIAEDEARNAAAFDVARETLEALLR